MSACIHCRRPIWWCNHPQDKVRDPEKDPITRDVNENEVLDKQGGRND